MIVNYSKMQFFVTLTGVAVGTLEGALRPGGDARGQVRRTRSKGRALGSADHPVDALDLERVLRDVNRQDGIYLRLGNT